MKEVSIIIILLAGFFNSFSQSKPERSPLNPEFINYVKYSSDNPEKKNADGYRLGYVPSPMYLHFNQTGMMEESRKSFQSLPAFYNLVDSGWVSSVKDQGPVGACWSFSTMGAIESRWLKLGFGTPSTMDLSEQNMATCHGFEAGINDGGSDFIAAAYLSRLSGPVTEASHPYQPVTNAACKSTGLIYPAYSPQTIWLPKDKNIIKKAILDYGAVTASIHMGSAYANYYSNLDKSFLYKGTDPVDHGVLVVGWNDNKLPKAGIYRPEEKGVWIVKNSWGTTFGDGGYFYVSYEDSKFLSSCSYYPERVEISEIDNMLMYDELGATQSYGLREEKASALARFNVENTEFINKIGTFVNASGSIIDIEIYKEFKDSVLTNKISSSYGNFCKFPGYYTFEIPASVQGVFYVKIKYFTPGYLYPIPVEAKIEYQGEAYALPGIEPKGYFWISKNEIEWLPLGKDVEGYEADLCIRVYSDRNTSLNPFFTSNKDIACINGSIIFTEDSNGAINSYAWNFGSGASPATANTAGPHTVTYTTTGLKNISLTVTGPAGTKTLSKNSYVEIVNSLDISLPYSEKLVIKGKSIPITAYGADTYTWSPSTGLDTTSGASINASPLETTTYTVNGIMGTCTGSATIKLNVVVGPANDDLCNASPLWPGKAKYNNIYATAEAGEPAPPEGDCETEMEWCVEGGIQNSVWFWFVGPEGGKVSITTLGFDTQVAMYEAENCDSIFLKKYKMIAAFDDYFAEDKLFAAALNNVIVTPGKMYFVQVDGSAGGQEGDFDLIYSYYPVSTRDEDIINQNADALKLYPNPNNGTFQYNYHSEKSETLRIRVINSKGQEMYKSSVRKAIGALDQEIRLGQLEKGFYIFELTSGQEVIHKNFLVK